MGSYCHRWPAGSSPRSFRFGLPHGGAGCPLCHHAAAAGGGQLPTMVLVDQMLAQEQHALGPSPGGSSPWQSFTISTESFSLCVALTCPHPPLGSCHTARHALAQPRHLQPLRKPPAPALSHSAKQRRAGMHTPSQSSISIQRRDVRSSRRLTDCAPLATVEFVLCALSCKPTFYRSLAPPLAPPPSPPQALIL